MSENIFPNFSGHNVYFTCPGSITLKIIGRRARDPHDPDMTSLAISAQLSKLK